MKNNFLNLNLDEENIFSVDDDAKIRCDLFKRKDKDDNVFYTGKLQFSGNLDFSDGQSLMIFLSEEDKEELQIGPIDPLRSSKKKESKVYINNSGKMCIPITPMIDSNNNVYYVAEARCDMLMPCKQGLFFSVFISKEGREEIQISKLNINVAKRKRLPKHRITDTL